MAVSANRRLTITIILLLAILLALTLIIISIGRAREQSDNQLAVEDPEKIDFVSISGEKEEVVLTRSGQRSWLVNGQESARPQAVKMLLGTLASMEVKSPVSDDFFSEATLNGKVIPVSVEVKSKGRLLKAFSVYLLSGAPDGNIFQKERSGDNFIAHLPGYDINPALQFISGSRYWKPFTIFEINPSDILSVEVTRRLPQEESFTIESTGAVLRLKLNGVAQERFDTSAVRQYIAWYTFVPFERWSTELDDSSVDSILSEEPVLTIRVMEQEKGVQDGIDHVKGEADVLDGIKGEQPVMEQLRGSQDEGEPFQGGQDAREKIAGSQGVREHIVRFWRIVNSDGSSDIDRLWGEKDRSGELFIVTYFDIDPIIIRGDYFISE